MNASPRWKRNSKPRLPPPAPISKMSTATKKMRPGQANLSMATAWVGENFGCLAYTLEMPFKDNHNLPDDDFGWNGQRSLRLGEAVLSAVLNVLPDLR